MDMLHFLGPVISNTSEIGLIKMEHFAKHTVFVTSGRISSGLF